MNIKLRKRAISTGLAATLMLSPCSTPKPQAMDLGEFGLIASAFGALAMGLGYLFTTVKTMGDIYISGNATKELVKLKNKNAEKMPVLSWKTLQDKIPLIKNELEKELAGQQQAINKIILQLRNHCTYLQMCEKLNVKPHRSLVLHFYGAPGVGKSSAMSIISRCLGIGLLSFGMPDAVADNGKNATTVRARLMDPDMLDNRVTKAYFKTELKKAIETKGTMIIVFDEIEKMRKLDARLSNSDYRNSEGYINPSSLDETMRDVKDHGKFAGYDVSDKIFITISNETENEINELEPSFKDRLVGNLVYFKQFDVPDYIELIKKSSKMLIESYQQDGISLGWTENCLEHYANEFYKNKYSGRRVVEFIDTVSGIVRDNEHLMGDSFNWSIDFDANTNEVKLVPAN